MAGLGYVSLRQWQTAAELLFREQARDMAAMAADKVEMTLRQTEDGLLARLQAILEAPPPREAALRDFVAATPLVRRLYLLDEGGEALYPAGPRDLAAGAAVAPLPAPWPGAWPRDRQALTVEGEPAVAAVLRQGRGPAALAVLVWNVQALCDDVLAPAFGHLGSPTILAVTDERGQPVYSKAPLAGADRLLTLPFRERLSSWRLAVYQAPGASPRATVRRQVTLFMVAFAVLLAVIVAGLVATWRLVRRETEMAQLKSDFVANVSHDLKTPLSVIRMFSETLEMGRVPDETRRQEYYAVIARESERLSRLIENVLNFSRIEGGRRTYDLVPTAVEPLVRDTLDAFGYRLASEGFTLKVEVAPDLPAVPMDADAVGQALANLVDNAIKYSADERAIAVEARREGGELAISVADRGIGIPREEQARIFDKFYRVGRSETQSRRGSGVGLALVRHIAEAHGGRVTVESAPGAGSRFTLWIPGA